MSSDWRDYSGSSHAELQETIAARSAKNLELDLSLKAQNQQNQVVMDELLDVDGKRKNEFLNADDYDCYSELLVISRVRRDKYQSQDVKLIVLIEKAIKKGVRNILMSVGKISDKQQWEKEQNRYLRVFYTDISIGYITSTGQQKSSAFIYVLNSLVETLHKKQINIIFNKEEVKIVSFFFSYESQQQYNQNIEIISPSTSHNGLDDQFVIDDLVQQTGSQRSSGRSSGLGLLKNSQGDPRVSLSNCHYGNWLKQAFIKEDYFKKQFIILSQTGEGEVKSGVSIYFVYRIMDDQIYAVKRSTLSSQVISFYDVFSTVSLGEQTADQRKIREAKILSKLNHPHILTLFDWWIEHEIDGYALYQMSEYCSYPGFQNQTNDLLNYAYYYLNQMHPREKTEQIKMIMLQILEGLEYIHRRGIVHRDLKPENIFVTITNKQELQVILADFDQGKDVREQKLSIITDEKLSENELSSIKSKNTIVSGTSGYQTANSQINKEYDKSDEFYALGVTLLHLIMAFPGDPKNRNLYTATFAMSEIDIVIGLFDTWASRMVKNKHKEFSFALFVPQLELAKKLLDKKVKEHDHIRQVVQGW